jgi:hypothetical protein
LVPLFDLQSLTGTLGPLANGSDTTPGLGGIDGALSTVLGTMGGSLPQELPLVAQLYVLLQSMFLLCRITDGVADLNAFV